MTDEFQRQWQAFAALLMQPRRSGADRGPAASGFEPWLEVAERFKAAAQGFLDGVSKTGAAAPGAQAAQRFGEFLRDQFADSRVPFTAGLAAADSFTHPLDAPALGATREHQQRWQRLSAAWQRIEEAQRRLQRLWSDALREAATTFTARLAERPVSEPSATVFRELYDAWIDCAENAYARMAHGEEFCQAQADCVNATSDWRAELQGGVEHWAKLLDLPTRSEINSLARRLMAVEERSGAPPKPAPKPARKPSARPERSSAAPARRRPRRKGPR